MNLGIPLSLALTLSFVIGLSGCDSSSGSTDTQGSPSLVSMTTPPNWQRRDNYPVATGVSADYVLFGPPAEGFAPNIIVLTTPASSISLDSAAAMEIRSASKSLTGAVVDSNLDRTLSGNPVRLLQIRANSNGQDLLVREFLAKKGGKDIQIVLTRRLLDTPSAALMAAAEESIRF